MIKIRLLSIIVLVSSSCSFFNNNNEFIRKNHIKKETYENLYCADENVCKSKGLGFTQFVIEYPNTLKLKHSDDKDTFIELEKEERGTITECLTIGNTTINLTNEIFAITFMKMFVKGSQLLTPNLMIERIGKFDFKGKETLLFEGSIDMTPYEVEKYKGVYKIVWIIPLPDKNEKINAVLVTFMANQEAGVSSFSDLENHSLIGNVWDTFRYIE